MGLRDGTAREVHVVLNSGGMNELEKFLSELHWIVPNLNDTFGYACADAEKISVGDGELLAKFWRQYGWHGLVAVAAVQRGKDPIPPVAEHPKYQEALKALLEEEGEWTLRDEFEIDP